ncbi:hypothetical protein DPEC_G00278160 [Dallia pectoralis]|uniref:Uncharacterized protein n=1 Tax=Dallia pectoralis TaxID=75939 RepID=A0ACC2FM59_DALPE|nr:hypothetical protein DPEC_G00278160 [Dallia pectoralis]
MIQFILGLQTVEWNCDQEASHLSRLHCSRVRERTRQPKAPPSPEEPKGTNDNAMWFGEMTSQISVRLKLAENIGRQQNGSTDVPFRCPCSALISKHSSETSRLAPVLNVSGEGVARRGGQGQGEGGGGEG